MKQLLSILFFAVAVNTTAQNNSFVKYFDSSWKPCEKEDASFYTEFERKDTVYKCTSYYFPSKQLYGNSFFTDTLFKKGIGMMVRYYKSGVTMDSTFFDVDGKVWVYKSYDESGNLQTIGGFIGNNYSIKSYNERQPDELKNLIGKAAEFPGGNSKWQQFLIKNLKAKTPIKNGAQEGKYSVSVIFLVNEDGSVSDIKAENDPGFGTKEEAIRTVSKSPKWNAATLNNGPVKYRARYQINFQVSAK